jgi:hypothetical protein
VATVLTVIGVVLVVLVALMILFDFMDSSGWPTGRPRIDWWTFFFGLLAIVGFAGLA